MSTLIVVLHVFVCVILIMAVLLQSGKGSDIGAAFGGASKTVFGATGAVTILQKITSGAAIVFMITSITLAIYSSGTKKEESLLDSEKNVTMPAQENPAAKPDDNKAASPASPSQPAQNPPSENVQPAEGNSAAGEGASAPSTGKEAPANNSAPAQNNQQPAVTP